MPDPPQGGADFTGNYSVYGVDNDETGFYNTLKIDAGVDILNPVQFSATDMDSKILKEKFGDKITFWGGGVDTQKILPFGSHKEVSDQIEQQINIFSPGGGFVFAAVHNIQANVPVENIVAMVNALKKFNGLASEI